MPEAGQPAPALDLPTDNGGRVSLGRLEGRPVVVYFYPKADTPGCTNQACGLRDVAGDIGDTAILGISPDLPAKQASFDEKYSLGYPLLSDPEHKVAEAYDGYTGPLKTQVVGPWTLAASLWLPRGDRVLSDHGATRDLGQSLAAGLVAHLEHVRTLVPGASPIVQLDEPSLPAVLSGGLKTLSGVGRLRRIDDGEARDVLGHVVDTVKAAGAQVVVHSCAPDVPMSLLHRLGVDGVSLDTSLLTEAAFEPLGEAIDSGLTLWAGLVPTSTAERHPRAHVEAFERMWHRIGFGAGEYDRIVVTPACGLAGLAPKQAVTVQRLAVEAVQMLADTSD